MTDLIPAGSIDREAVLRSIGLNARDPKTQALLLVCDRYDLDPILGHVVIVQSKVYVTHAGYMHVAHASGVFAGMEVVEEKETDQFYWAKVAVYRKDMERSFQATARCAKSEKTMAPQYDMAIIRAERRALKRAFDVAGLPDGGDGDYEENLELVDAIAPADRETGEITVGRKEEWRDALLVPAEPPLPEELETDEAGEVDEFDRISLQTRIDKMCLEFRVIASTDWISHELPRIKDMTRRVDYEKADNVLGLIEARQKQTYLARRLEVLQGLESVHIAKDADKKRHAFIAEATNGETESAKELTADQRDAVMAMVAEVRAAEEAAG